MEGTVKWFNRKNGYGFITGDDEVDYFVHRSAFPEEVMINEEDRVSFNTTKTDRGLQAQDVALLDGGASSDSGGVMKEPSAPEPGEAPPEEEVSETKEEVVEEDE